MNTVFKVMALIFALLFIWAAAVQYNDPDTLIWVLVYGLASLFSVLFLVKRLSFPLALGAALAYLVGTVYVWPDKFEGFAIGAGDIINIERGREAFGLLIIALVLLAYALRIRYLNKS